MHFKNYSMKFKISFLHVLYYSQTFLFFVSFNNKSVTEKKTGHLSCYRPKLTWLGPPMHFILFANLSQYMGHPHRN